MSVNSKTHGTKYTHQSWVRYGGAATKMAAEGWIFNGDHTSADAAHKSGSAQVGRYERQQRGSGRTLQYHVTAHGENPPGPISQYSAHSLRDANGVRHGDAMKNPGLEAAAAKAHSAVTTVHADSTGTTDVHNHIKGTAQRFNDLQAAHSVADRMTGAKGGAAVMHGDAHSKYVVVSMADAQRLEKAGHKWADHPGQAAADAAAHARSAGTEHYAKGMQEGHEKAYAKQAKLAADLSTEAKAYSTKAMASNTRADHHGAKEAHSAAAYAHQHAAEAAKVAGLSASQHGTAIGVHQGGANAHRDAEARAPIPPRSPGAAGIGAAKQDDRDRLVTMQHATKGAAGEKIPPPPPSTGMHNPALEKLAATAHAQRTKENATASRVAGAKQGGDRALQTGKHGGTFYTTPSGRKVYTKK